MKKITLYADGAARNNGKPDAICGYGVLLLNFEDKKKKEIKQATIGATNNIMELQSVICGLKFLKEASEVEIYSDSKYVTDAFNQKWIYGWVKNGWVNSQKKTVKNKELWEELYSLTKFHKCTFHWVKGHASNPYNNRCDQLANIAMDELINSGI